MTDSELEELRYDVAYALLKNMSKGSQFQYALDKMLELIKDDTEEELTEMAHSIRVNKQKKPKDKPKGF